MIDELEQAFRDHERDTDDDDDWLEFMARETAEIEAWRLEHGE